MVINKIMIRFLILLVFISGQFVCSALNVVFRYDDFRLVDDDFQKELLHVFQKYNVPLTVAIIPCNIQDEFILDDCWLVDECKRMHKNGILHFALHGYNHVGEIGIGEFAGKNYDEQMLILSKGSKMLDSVFGDHTCVFIPPWNRYDDITTDVLANLGFKAISAELNSCLDFSDSRFQYYPMTVDKPCHLNDIIRNNGSRDGVVVCMFHRYDFAEDYSMNEFSELIKNAKNNKDVNVVSFDDLLRDDFVIDKECIDMNMKKPLFVKLMHAQRVLFTTEKLHKIRIYDLLVHLALLIFVAFCGCVFVRYKRLYCVIQICAISIISTIVWNGWIIPRYMTPSAIMIVAVIAIMFVVCECFICRKSND